MYVYIINSQDKTKIVSSVTLQKGCIPVIGDEISDSDLNLGDRIQIEPAIWFKVLILDSVTLDCVKRCIRWSTEPLSVDGSLSGENEENKQGDSQLLRTLFTEGECYDYESNLDELFDSILCLLSEYSDSQTFNRTLIRLLHCQILPVIKLSRDDISLLEGAKQRQIKIIKDVDLEIDSKNQRIQDIKDHLKKERKSLVNQFQDCEQLKVFPGEFVSLVLSHFERDIKDVEVDFDVQQSDVDQEKCKKLVNEKELARKRKLRDECHQKYINLIEIREQINQAKRKNEQDAKLRSLRRSFTLSNRKSKNKLHLSFSCSYLELNKTLVKEKHALEIIIDRKVMVLSVKEALDSTISELQTDGVSVGIETERGTHRRATDVLRKASIPIEWLTLSEKVASIVTDETHPIGQQHAQFCKTLEDQCRVVMEEDKLWQSSKLMSPYQQSLGTQSVPTRKGLDEDGSIEIASEPTGEFFPPICATPNTPGSQIAEQVAEINHNEFVFIWDTEEINPLVKFTNSSKDGIHEHFDEMCNNLQAAIGNNSRTGFNKIWLCYENHFFKQVGESLRLLFELTYSNVCETFRQEMWQLSPYDLEIQEPWLMQLIFNCETKGDNTEVKTMFSEMNTFSPYAPACFGSSPPPPYTITENDRFTSDHGDHDGRHCSESESENATVTSMLVTHECLDLENLSAIANHETLKSNASADVTENKCSSGIKDGPGVHVSLPNPPSPSGEDITKQMEDCDLISCDTVRKEGDIEPITNTPVDAPVVTMGSPPCNQRFHQVFSHSIQCVEDFINEPTPLLKLQQLTKCLRSISNQVSKLRAKQNRGEVDSCTDDIVTVLILLLMHCSRDVVCALRSQINFLELYIPPFLENGAHGYALVQFEVAFQHISTAMLKKRNIKNLR